MYHNRLNYLRQSVKELLEYGYSDAYIEAVLYTGEFSMQEINTAIADMKSILVCNN
jgi:hypothetical protein